MLNYQRVPHFEHQWFFRARSESKPVGRPQLEKSIADEDFFDGYPRGWYMYITWKSICWRWYICIHKEIPNSSGCLIRTFIYQALFSFESLSRNQAEEHGPRQRGWRPMFALRTWKFHVFFFASLWDGNVGHRHNRWVLQRGAVRWEIPSLWSSWNWPGQNGTNSFCWPEILWADILTHRLYSKCVEVQPHTIGRRENLHETLAKWW